MLDISEKSSLAVKRHAMRFMEEHGLTNLNAVELHRMEWGDLNKLQADARRAASQAIDTVADEKGEAHARSVEVAVDALTDLVRAIDNEKDERSFDGSRAPRSSPGDPRRPYGGTAEVRGMAGFDRHEEVFCNWLRSPENNHTRSALLAAEAESRSANSLTGGAGGFVVPEVIQTPIMARARDENPFRSIVRVVKVESGDVKFPLSEADATNGWVGETDTRAGTDEPNLVSKAPTFGTSYAYIMASEELMADAAIDIGQWFQEEAGRALGEAEMTAIVSGNGTNKPSGLLKVSPESGADGSRTTDAFKYIASGSAADLGSTVTDLLADVYYDLKASYRSRGRWLMNSATAGVLRKAKDGDGRPLWADSLREGQPSMLMGHGVTICEAMPDIGEDAHPIAFGDFGRAYVFAMRGGLGVTVDDNITTPGMVKFYIRERVGGCVYDENAVRFVKCAVS